MALSAEEVSVYFGVRQARQTGRAEKSGQTTNRIVLSPSAAKRFALLLRDFLHDHQSRFGSLGPDDEVEDALRSPASIKSLPSPIEKDTARKAEELISLIHGLKAKYGFERSFKISPGALLGNRFLLLLNKLALGPESDTRLLEICKNLSMPDSLFQRYEKSLAEAGYAHFGFEDNGDSCVYKAYLESWTNWEDEIEGRREDKKPTLVHQGFKWDAADRSRNALTRYVWHPCLTFDEMKARAVDIYQGSGAREVSGAGSVVVNAALEMASGKVSDENVLFLEVSEEGNERRSFDINFYRAGLRINDIAPMLVEAASGYSIDSDQFQVLYDRTGNSVLGHLSSGVGRDGNDFLTVYYGLMGH